MVIKRQLSFMLNRNARKRNTRSTNSRGRKRDSSHVEGLKKESMMTAKEAIDRAVKTPEEVIKEREVIERTAGTEKDPNSRKIWGSKTKRLSRN
jgi:hypothetical protein